MTFDPSRPIPILLISDGPDSHTGLGRICHDLAWLLSSMPQFRVGVLGRASFGRTKFPWTAYSFGIHEGWGQGRALEAWQDLSQGQYGIIFTVWDATRLQWFALPEQAGMGARFAEQMGSDRKFQRWGYFMQDTDGINAGRLPGETEYIMRQYDRVLLASKWARYIAANSLDGAQDVDWIPHGINTKSFSPYERDLARSFWKVGADEILVGAVATNQERKSWPTMMEAIARMNGKPRFWIKTDKLHHYWNLQSLAAEYGLMDRIILDEGENFTDREMAIRYSACDATMLISGGEGFGYPVAESLSCGTPVVTGDYGAQAELTKWIVPTVSSRIDTIHNVRRASYLARDVAAMMDVVVAENRFGEKRDECRELVSHLEWQRIGKVWSKWILKGVSA